MDISADLLTWYDRNRRQLPWRGCRDPYVIWVSEIIFQQTRIEQGTSYFLRFIERFPDIQSLALAQEDEVLRIWQGLGYYSRARNLMFSARKIMADYGGVFPVEFELIRALKGIGDYTASCIVSICFNQPHAAVDGNVFRVLSRLHADVTPIHSTVGEKRFKELAQQHLDTNRPGDFNEGMMDLGAMICLPRNPQCNLCPLSTHCRARESGQPEQFPVRERGKIRTVRSLNYLLAQTGNRILVRKRKEKDIWKGLYELPPAIAGFDRMDPLSAVRHPLSHADLDIRFYPAQDPDECIAAEPGLIWIDIRDISRYPFPKPLADFLEQRFPGADSTA